MNFITVFDNIQNTAKAKEKEEKEWTTPKFSSIIDPPKKVEQRNQFIPLKHDIKNRVKNDLFEASRKYFILI
jgi:hypothetical protein